MMTSYQAAPITHMRLTIYAALRGGGGFDPNTDGQIRDCHAERWRSPTETRIGKEDR